MRLLDRLSVRKKLMLVLLLISSSVLFFSSIAFLINDWYTLQNMTFERLRAQADIVGNSAVSAIVFEDRASAVVTVTILEKEHNIQAAVIFDRDDELFASYTRHPSIMIPELPEQKAGYIDDWLFVTSELEFSENKVGSILLVSDLSEWRQSQIVNLLTAGAVFLLSLLVAYLLSSWLQRIVTVPILKLADTARRVSQRQDYSVRASKVSEDEIGGLVDDFNHMLDQIQTRDSELYEINEQLEDKVRKRTEELFELTQQLEHQAYFDHLTGLANRITFDNNLRLTIEHRSRYGGQIAVLFLDIDRFKNVNDTLGHAVGDQLLKEISNRFSKYIRKSDTLARFGGDEFAVLLPELEHSNTAMTVADHLLKSMLEPFQLQEHTLHVSTSIGISVYPEDGGDAETLIKNADVAMYRSKDFGRNRVTYYSKELNALTERRLKIESMLREAVNKKLFKIYYQPKLDTNTLQVTGVEALVRWFDADGKAIPPEDFIPIAEETGLIAGIDEWVLETACREILKLHQDAGAPVSLAVNFSPAHFIRHDLDQVITQILEETGFPAKLLELEVTESVFGPDNTDIYSIFNLLKQKHIRIAIDDFGTAYSSLSRLKHLPLHTLKIDKSFIQDVGRDVDDEIITQTIVSMANSLNLHVVAEGVENEEQYRFVQHAGCDSVQGFLFGRPMPIDDLTEYLRSVKSTEVI